VNLDLNSNGKVGFLEYPSPSPVRGALSAANQPLSQRFNWPTAPNGTPLPIESFPRVSGIPVTLYNLLVAQCGGVTAVNAGCADPTGRQRAQGPGGPLPAGTATDGRQVPVGFVLDPRRTGAFEKEVEAEFVTAFFDLVYIVEDKLTATRRICGLPEWLQVNSLASLNYRKTRATGYRYGGDFSTNRAGVMTGSGEMTPNTTFVHSFDNQNLLADGAPWTANYRTDYWESGLGLMFDVDVFDRLSLLLGARYDCSKAQNIDYAGTFNPTTGASANPGRFVTTGSLSEGRDDGIS
jgi:iron complex outermembrane receptor protein